MRVVAVIFVPHDTTATFLRGAKAIFHQLHLHKIHVFTTCNYHIRKFPVRHGCFNLLARITVTTMLLPTSSTSTTTAALAALVLLQAGVASAGCSSGGDAGCSPPSGPKWDHWSMAASTYVYCYQTDGDAGCPVEWMIDQISNGTAPAPALAQLANYAGVVGVDHYYTNQGVPCVNGKPHEFDNQVQLAARFKGHFPGVRFMTYRILDAVPYDMVVRNKMVESPEYFVRWMHQPGSSSPGNESICYNFRDACFNSPKEINDPANNCSFEIRAAAYNWANPDVRAWYQENIIEAALEHADGMWLDGNGPDNGAYMCSGICCGFGADNSPHNQSEIDAYCAGEVSRASFDFLIFECVCVCVCAHQHACVLCSCAAAPKCVLRVVRGLLGVRCVCVWCVFIVVHHASTQVEVARTAHEYMAQHGAYEIMSCTHYLGASSVPTAKDDAAQCADKMRKMAAWGADHANYNMAVAYGDRTSKTAGSYDDESAEAAVAAFMIMRGAHWLMAVEPLKTLNLTTALLLTSDYGRPRSNMTEVRPSVFQRVYDNATVTLDCNTFEGTFTPTTTNTGHPPRVQPQDDIGFASSPAVVGL